MRKYSGGEFTLSRPMSEYSTNFITLRNRKDRYVKHTETGNAGDRSLNAAWLGKNFGTTRSVTFEHVTDTRDNVYEPMSGRAPRFRRSLPASAGTSLSRSIRSATRITSRRATHRSLFCVDSTASERDLFPSTTSSALAVRIRSAATARISPRKSHGAGLSRISFPDCFQGDGSDLHRFGGAWDTGFKPENMHGSVGIGLGLNTPIGPLRLDYGRGSQGGRVHFRVGGTF